MSTSETVIGRTLHVPVLLEEILVGLLANKGGTFLDCTLGGGGHSRALLNAHPMNRVFALDRDLRAIERTRAAIPDERLTIRHASFSRAAEVYAGHQFDGILVDLGISTDQLKEGRGFSFRDEESLDMRMDETQEFTAAHLLNELGESELFRLLKEGGVGKEARSVTNAIIRNRPHRSSSVVSEIVQKACLGIVPRGTTNPATVVFQAIRIAVNKELEEIRSFLSQLPTISHSGSRLAVISFHSLEDKEVTRVCRKWESGDTPPASMPGMWRAKSIGRLLSKKAILPSEEEVLRNPSSRSARLRIFEFH